MAAGIDQLMSLPGYAMLGDAAYRPGLDRINSLLETMDHPERTFRSIHVAGTNGKGSTASMIAAVGDALGFRVGLHTSPHIRDVAERMRVGGVPAPVIWLDERVRSLRSAFASIEPSFFEATVALSFLYFAEQAVDWAIVEVGLGGRLDATNVLDPQVCAITRIAHDHTQILGEGLGVIAREKAGIVKKGRPLVLYPAPPEIETVVEGVCEARDAPFHATRTEVHVSNIEKEIGGQSFDMWTVRANYGRLHLGLAGKFQVENARVAIRSAELAWGDLIEFDGALRGGLSSVAGRSGLRARLEIVRSDPLLLADVAHNPDGVRTALEAASELAPNEGARLLVLFAVMSDKDVAGIALVLARTGATVYCVRIDSPRAVDASALAESLREHGVGVAGSGSVADGIATLELLSRRGDVTIGLGSHLLVQKLLETVPDRHDV